MSVERTSFLLRASDTICWYGVLPLVGLCLSAIVGLGGERAPVWCAISAIVIVPTGLAILRAHAGIRIAFTSEATRKELVTGGSMAWRGANFRNARPLWFLLVSCFACFACFATSCDRRAHDHEHDGAHVHVAPHGGTLVPLGEEFANLELVLDSTSGTLTAFVLDGHAENALRVKQAELVLEVALADSKAFEMRLPAVESALSGEKKGDSSEFKIVDARLAGVSQLRGQVLSLEVRGRPFAKVAFELKTPESGK